MNATCNQYGFEAVPYDIRTVNGYMLRMYRLRDLNTAERVKTYEDLLEDEDGINKPFVD